MTTDIELATEISRECARTFDNFLTPAIVDAARALHYGGLPPVDPDLARAAARTVARDIIRVFARELARDIIRAIDVAREVGCECGQATGIACGWVGARKETVTIEHMADRPGTYPANGGMRMQCAPSCAQQLLSADSTARIVLEETP